MAEKKKYNSILISGRKDQTLTYSKYVKDEESGESVKESLDKKVNVTDELTTQQIKDGAITNEKMAADSVGNTNLQDGSVSNEKLEDGSITNEKLAENSITKDKLKDNTIGVEKLDPELRQTINAATGLPENLVETIQNVDDTLKDHQSQLDDKQSQIDDKQQQITANDEDISLLQTRSTQMEETIKSIAATGGASQATAVTYNNEKSGLTAINAQAAIDETNTKLSDLSNNTELRDEEDNVIQTPFSYHNSNKYLVVELDSLGRFLAGTLSDGSHYAYNMNSETIDDLRERKVDKEEGMSMIENEVKECFNVIKDGIYPFCIIDNNRRVHLYVDKNGKTHLFGEIESPTIDAINKKISPVLYTTDLDWNVFFTVGDSLCTSGIWQLALCKYRNCSYDVSYGAEVSNMGGTITLDDNFRCGQSRLKRVIEDKNPMILIYENYNDISCLKNIGNKNDVPYFIGDNVIIDKSFNSYEEASDYWMNNATELLASLEKKVGIVVKIPYNTRNQAGAVYVSGSAKNDGFLSLRVNMKEVNITIKKGDNSTEILRKIEEVNYPNCRNEKTEDYVKFINNDGSQSWVEFTHTPQIDGVTFSINYLDATTYLCKTFVSKDINKWNDITCWKSFGEISLWSAYKGLIEYFLKKCPTQRLIWFIPRVVFLERNIESSSYNPKLWYEDGTINIAEYKKNVGENDTLANLQKEVCQMYGIECVDLNDMLGVNVVNESSWCNNHDVHPTEMLYNKWGWCISKLIK